MRVEGVFMVFIVG